VKQYIVTHELRSAQSRKETFLGRTFRVVPAVLVRSQVLRNNIGATLLPADVITEEWAELWNNIPVLVGPHPSLRGVPISGRSPELLNERGAGWIFKACAEQEQGGTRRLVAEVWLDEARADSVPGLQAVLDAVNSGRRVELSTGFPVNIETVNGVFNSENYEAVIRPAGADHLVISTEMTGACSVSDGCGLGVNQETKPMAEGKGQFSKLLERAAAMLERKPSKMQTAWDEMTAAKISRELASLNSVTASDQEKANAVRDALQAKFGGQDRNIVVCDVYSADSLVVFWFMTPFGPEPAGQEYFRCSYTEDGGAYNFGEYERVRRMTVYESVANAANAATAVNAESNKPCGCHQEASNMDAKEKQELLDSVNASVTSALKPIGEQLAKVGEVATNAAKTAVDSALATFKTGIETSINEIKEQVKTVTTAVNAERDRERTALVTELAANVKTKDVYSAADLESMNVEQLRKVAQLAKIEVTSFTGRAPAATNTRVEEEPAFIAPVPYFATNKKQENTGASGEAK
jgi:hypothetical protein